MLRLGVFVFVVTQLSGCYVLQAANGQWQVMARRQPIVSVLDDPETPPKVKTRLEQVLALRQFAVSELGLPDNGSYSSYADLGRPYVVWNVVATPEFSTEPRHWCFLIAGCVAYRGYFSERRAHGFADRLRRRGLDVFVGGVPAYSTLGHFKDPVLNTMIDWSEVQLAAILFHELTHQLIYVSGDSQFNEALASVVEEEGVRRWLLSSGREAELARYRDSRRLYGQAAELLIAARYRLRDVYAGGTGPAVMREEKRRVLDQLQADYQAFKASLAPARVSLGFDAWMTADLNNAHLASVATYEQCVPGLKALLVRENADLQAFYRAARELARLKPKERQKQVCQP